MARLRMLQTKTMASTGSRIFMHNWLIYGTRAMVSSNVPEEESTPDEVGDATDTVTRQTPGSGSDSKST
jgi:hypothetical protein